MGLIRVKKSRLVKYYNHGQSTYPHVRYSHEKQSLKRPYQGNNYGLHNPLIRPAICHGGTWTMGVGWLAIISIFGQKYPKFWSTRKRTAGPGDNGYMKRWWEIKYTQQLQQLKWSWALRIDKRLDHNDGGLEKRSFSFQGWVICRLVNQPFFSSRV